MAIMGAVALALGIWLLVVCIRFQTALKSGLLGLSFSATMWGAAWIAWSIVRATS